MRFKRTSSLLGTASSSMRRARCACAMRPPHEIGSTLLASLVAFAFGAISCAEGVPIGPAPGDNVAGAGGASRAGPSNVAGQSAALGASGVSANSANGDGGSGGASGSGGDGGAFDAAATTVDSGDPRAVATRAETAKAVTARLGKRRSKPVSTRSPTLLQSQPDPPPIGSSTNQPARPPPTLRATTIPRRSSAPLGSRAR